MVGTLVLRRSSRIDVRVENPRSSDLIRDAIRQGTYGLETDPSFHGLYEH
jgi:hypothetical protein